MHRPLQWIFVCLLACALDFAHAEKSTSEKQTNEVHTFRQQGAYADAEKAALAAVREAEASGREDVELARSWNNLGAVYYDVGRYQEAEKL